MSSTRNPFDLSLHEVYIQEPASPAAGASAVIPTPGNTRALLATMAFRLITDANVADRTCILERLKTGVNQIIAADMNVQTASFTGFYSAHVGGAMASKTNPLTHAFSLPNSRLFKDGDTLQINILNQQAGDQIGQILLTWHVWKWPQ